MQSNEVKALFMKVLERARAKYVFSIDNFCIMENHFHFIIKPGKGENLSRIMQWIMSVFAMALNRRNGWKGHVWGERFYSTVISSFRAFVEVFDYIDFNPVKAGIAKLPQEWQFGGASWHRRGLFGLIVRMPALLLCQFPSHAQLCLPAPAGG